MIEVLDLEPGHWHAIACQFSDYTYEQNDAFNEAAARRWGAVHRCVAVRESGKLIGAASVRLKFLPGLRIGMAYISGGPLIRSAGWENDRSRLERVLTALRDRFAVKGKCILRAHLSVILDDVVDAEQLSGWGFKLARDAVNYETFLIDLSADEKVLRARLRGEWRNRLNKAERSEIDLSIGRDTQFIERFQALYGEMRSFKTFQSSVSPEHLLDLDTGRFNFEVLIASKDGADVGGHIVCYTPAVATYFLGATSRKGLELHAGTYLTWRAIVRVKERGQSIFDLGGVNQALNPDGYKFKASIGGAHRVALGPFEARPTNMVIDRSLASVEWIYRMTKRQRAA